MQWTLSIVPANEILQNGLAAMKISSFDCRFAKEDTEEQKTRKTLRCDVIELALKNSNYKKYDSEDHLEGVLRMGVQLPPALHKCVFEYVFGHDIDARFLQRNIGYILNCYVDEKEFGIYAKRPFIINYGVFFKVNAPWYDSIQLKCDEIALLSGDEKSLLIKIIEGNTRAWSANNDNSIVSLSEDRTIPAENKQKYGTLYKIKETDMPTMKKILEHNFSYTVNRHTKFLPKTAKKK